RRGIDVLTAHDRPRAIAGRGSENEHPAPARLPQPAPQEIAAVAVTAVKGDHERHGRLSVRRLGNVEGEPAADFALVRCVQDAPPLLVVAQGGGAQALDENVVVASRRLEEPATHRLERRGERRERLLGAAYAEEG